MLLNENSIIYNALLRLFDNGELLSAQQRWELLREVIRSVCAEDLNEIMGRIETKYKLQIKRGNQEANDGYTGLPGEITMDTTNNTMRLHDGTTQGGHTVGSGGGADVDLSNLSVNGKSMVSSLGMPDYSAPISKNWDTSYLAECDILVVYKTNHTSGDPSVEVSLSHDGVDFTSLKSSNAGSGSLLICGDFVVPSGYYWKIIGGRNIDRKLTVFPIKGCVQSSLAA